MVNRHLLHSTGKIAQYSVITCMGKKSEKKRSVYMYNRITLLYSRNYHNIVKLTIIQYNLKNKYKKFHIQMRKTRQHKDDQKNMSFIALMCILLLAISL